MRARVLAFLVVAACSSGSNGSVATTFPITLTSDSGALRLELTATPDPPAVGTDTFELTISNVSDGSPRDDMTVKMTPFMPSMGHGTATTTVSPLGGGKYRVTDVYLFMPGTWELETTFSGPLSDHATPTFELQ
jgi:hypothetical protein